MFKSNFFNDSKGFQVKANKFHKGFRYCFLSILSQHIYFIFIHSYLLLLLLLLVLIVIVNFGIFTRMFIFNVFKQISCGSIKAILFFTDFAWIFTSKHSWHLAKNFPNWWLFFGCRVCCDINLAFFLFLGLEFRGLISCRKITRMNFFRRIII